MKEINHPLGVDEEGGAEREFSAHLSTRNLRHKHIIEFISAIHRDPGEEYLMFVWANGQDLGKYWSEVRKPALSKGFIRDVIEQFHGLIDGLCELHNKEDGHFRHTDIKPDNILRSIDDPVRGRAEIGLLQISDMGLAKCHTVPTGMRHGTDARASTTRYRPPEAAFETDKRGMSRRYDIWSMGCVILELIIWLLHGTDTLDKFNNDWLRMQDHSTATYFKRLTPKRTTVHPVVQRIMGALLEDPECRGETAVGDLLRLVKDRMLVVGLESGTHLTVPGMTAYPDSEGARATSKELLEELSKILVHAKDSSYWFTGNSREDVAPLKNPQPDGDEEESSSNVANPRLITITVSNEHTGNGSTMATQTYSRTNLVRLLLGNASCLFGATPLPKRSIISY